MVIRSYKMWQDRGKASVAAEKRNEILERLNALDPGPTQDERRADREARIKQTIETEDAL
jgi:hypothetical protein